MAWSTDLQIDVLVPNDGFTWPPSARSPQSRGCGSSTPSGRPMKAGSGWEHSPLGWNKVG